MSMIFHCTKLHLSKCNGSWVVSTKLNKNLNIQLSSMFVFFAFHKNCPLNVHHLKMHQHTSSHVDWFKFYIQSEVC
jgi:hypothetical protein